MAKSAPGPVHVVIYGEHSDDWMTALSPASPIWSQIPYVTDVRQVPMGGEISSAAPPRDDVTTVVIPLLEDHIKACPSDHTALIPTATIIDTLSNKAAFADHIAAQRLSHLCPTTYRHVEQARFPCVVKRLDLNAGVGVAVATSMAELQTLLAQPPWQSHQVVLQELVPGKTDYTTHFIVMGGRILWHMTYAFEMAGPDIIRTPNNLKRMRPVKTSAATLNAIRAILLPLGYNGPCNVDYKLPSKDRVAVFEVNPRLGGTLMMRGSRLYLRDMLTCLIHTAAFGERRTPFRSALFHVASSLRCLKAALKELVWVGMDLATSHPNRNTISDCRPRRHSSAAGE